MAGNGNGSRNVHPRVDEPAWEEVRAFAWELRRCRELCFDPTAAFAIRNVEGEVIVTGPSEYKIQVAVDASRMVERMLSEIGTARRERFYNWVDGVPVAELREVEKVQLKADVCRLEELATTGGYREFLLKRRDVSGSEG